MFSFHLETADRPKLFIVVYNLVIERMVFQWRSRLSDKSHFLNFLVLLVACMRLYSSLGRSVGQSVGRSVGQSVGRSVSRSVGRSVITLLSGQLPQRDDVL